MLAVIGLERATLFLAFFFILWINMICGPMSSLPLVRLILLAFLSKRHKRD